MKNVVNRLPCVPIIVLGIATSFTPSANALTITSSNNGDTLSSTILGEGINLIPGSVSYTGADNASGFFDNGIASGINIENGIILTTGNANDAVAPNNSDFLGTMNGVDGDAELSSLIDGFDTFDAAILEFEFESASGELFLDFVFASDEYNEFIRSGSTASGGASTPNDVLGFFLDGENIALVPGTDISVSVNSINGGNPLGVNAANPDLFNNNDPSDGGPFFDLQYDGFTNVLTARASGLAPGTHSIKLAIADVVDNSLDSAVFIAANSFSNVGDPGGEGDDPITTPEPNSLIGFLVLGLISSLSFLKKSTKFSFPIN